MDGEEALPWCPAEAPAPRSRAAADRHGRRSSAFLQAISITWSATSGRSPRPSCCAWPMVRGRYPQLRQRRRRAGLGRAAGRGLRRPDVRRPPDRPAGDRRTQRQQPGHRRRGDPPLHRPARAAARPGGDRRGGRRARADHARDLGARLYPVARNHFPELEEGAETLGGALGDPLSVAEPLRRRLKEAYGVVGAVVGPRSWRAPARSTTRSGGC
jgi:hypothetical protein